MRMTIIKNYGMPHNCYDCDLHNYHECDLTGESIEEDYCWNGDSREKHCPLREVEAIPKDQYEARLKADMVAMLTEIQLEIEKINHNEYCKNINWCNSPMDRVQAMRLEEIEVEKIIQQKINKLRGNEK